MLKMHLAAGLAATALMAGSGQVMTQMPQDLMRVPLQLLT